MKRMISMLIVMALLLAMAPAVFAADAQVLVDVADQAVTAESPYVYEGVAESNGTLTVTPSGSPDWGFKVSIGDTEGVMQSGSFADYDWAVAAGDSYKVEVFAYTNWSQVDGTVGLKLTFTPTEGTVEEKSDYVFDGSSEAEPLKVGTYSLVLDTSAYNTLYSFTPDEIGIYTLTVNDGAVIGYWGAGSFYVKNPGATGTSIQREIKSVGQSVVVGISSDDPNVTLTIEKTGESAGIVETVYTNWENVHTPSAELAGTPANIALVDIDITQAHTVALGDDGFYHMDSATGPILYVDLKNGEFDLGLAYGSYGALTMRGEYNGVNYDFKTAMSAYNNVLTGTDGVYPVTEDLYAFLIGYGHGAGLWYDENLSCFAEIQAGDFYADSAWMVMCGYGVEVETPEQTLTLTAGENPVSLLPGVNFILRLDLGDMLEPAGTMTWGSGVTVTADGVEVSSPYDLSSYNSHVLLVATVSQQTLDTFVITVPEEEAAFQLVLGSNAVEVADSWEGTVASYTAAEDGEYVLSAGEGETNADISILTATGNETVTLPYTFSLKAGESIEFVVLTQNWEPDTVDLALSKKVALPDGLYKGEDDNFYYYLNGEIAAEYTGLVDNAAGSWYILNGVAQMSFDGVVEIEGAKYLIKAGHVNTAYTGLIRQDGGIWLYFAEGIQDMEHVGLITRAGMQGFVENGQVNFNKSGVVDDNGTRKYVKYGIWRNTFKGLARQDDGSWVYMVNGAFDASFTGVAKLNSLWVYVADGYVDFNFSGTFNVNGVDYTIQYGVVQF